MNNFHYRPEIDGLRAIAVLSVIFFHAGFQYFPGGYVGVDVFFVISGYLITSIIIKENDLGSFSIKKFYLRRARRILPALFVVILVCFFSGIFILTPEQFRMLSQTIISVVLFLSNILFFFTTGYFSTSSNQIPMLHTWSLSVEEQFYIIFPLFLFLCWKYKVSNLFYILVLISVFSFFLAEYLFRVYPTGIFYLPITRAWEILAGSICALILSRKGIINNELYALAGLLMIISSVFIFDEKTRWPSFYTLLPVIGTMLYVLNAHRNTLVAKLFSFKIIVGIGLVSYSAYLWHHPLFAFAHMKSLNEPTFPLMFGLILLSFLFSYLSWRYVETPCREISVVPTKKIVFYFFSASIFILAISGFSYYFPKHHENYFIRSLSDKEKYLVDLIKRHQGYDMHATMEDNEQCKFWYKDITDELEKRFGDCLKLHEDGAVVVLGDSHALNIYNSLYHANVGDFLMGISQGGCRPYVKRPDCQYQRFDEFLNKNSINIKAVIFHQSGSYMLKDRKGRFDHSSAYISEDSFEIDKGIISEVSNYVESMTDKVNVIWLGPFVEARVDFSLNKLSTIEKNNFQFNPISLKAFEYLESYLLSYHESGSIHYKYVSLWDILKIKPDFLIQNNCLTVRDNNHFSKCGEKLIAEKMKSNLHKFMLYP